MPASLLYNLPSDKIYPLSRFLTLTSSTYPFPTNTSYQKQLYLLYLNQYGHITRIPNSNQYYYSAFTPEESVEAAKLRQQIRNQVFYYTRRQSAHQNIKKLTQLQLQELHSHLLSEPIKMRKKKVYKKKKRNPQKKRSKSPIPSPSLKQIPYMKAVRYRIESLQNEYLEKNNIKISESYFSLRKLTEAIYQKSFESLHFIEFKTELPEELHPYLSKAENILNKALSDEIYKLISFISRTKSTVNYSYLLECDGIMRLCTDSEKEIIDKCFSKYKKSPFLVTKPQWKEITIKVNKQIPYATYFCKCYNFEFYNNINWDEYNEKYDMSEIQKVINEHYFKNISKFVKQIKNPDIRNNVSELISLWAAEQLGNPGGK